MKSVRAVTGAWDAKRRTEGAYSCLLEFADGAFASLVYSGYAHFDSDEFCGWIGEMGRPKDPGVYGAARRALTQSSDEQALKANRNYGGEDFQPVADAAFSQHFGVVIASCERADLRPLPAGVMIYGDSERRLVPLPAPGIPRAEVIDELCGAVGGSQAPLHSGEWALATLEVCLAILRSGQEQKEILLANQSATSVLRT